MDNRIEIDDILHELNNISGFRISIHDKESGEVAAFPHSVCSFCTLMHGNPDARKLCFEADAEASAAVSKLGGFHLYKCRFGLYEAIAPLYHFGIPAGYLMMGQVTDEKPESRQTILKAAAPYTKDRAALEKAVSEIPSVPFDKMISYIKIMTVCAEYITLSGSMGPGTTELAPLTKAFLHQHMSENVTLDKLCRRFGCSKTTLMNAFRNEYHMTIVHYLTGERIERAKELLVTSNETVNYISATCGFKDQNYFSKVFLKAEGLSPTDYRRKYQKARPSK